MFKKKIFFLIVFFSGDPNVSVEPHPLVCFTPSAINLKAELLTDNSSYQINTTWNSSKRPSFLGCRSPFCKKSRRYKAQLLIFNSPPQENDYKPDKQTKWLSTSQRRQTFKTFEGPEISPDQYYKFLVKTEEEDTHMHASNTAHEWSSNVCYFGEQGK